MIEATDHSRWGYPAAQMAKGERRGNPRGVYELAGALSLAEDGPCRGGGAAVANERHVVLASVR